MANDAIASIQATILPDEIAKTISATMTVSPTDDNDKWYYKKTSVSNTGTEDLIAGNYTDGDEIIVDISDVDDGLIFHKQTDLAIIK